MRSNEWGRYVRYVIGDDDQTTVAARVGVSQPTVGRWLKGMVPDPGTVAALAEEYGRSVPEAFVAAGMLTVDQVGRSLSKASREMLAGLFSGEQPGDPPQAAKARRRRA
jgi:transcriptional regulator with XRE-family HTH domain